MKSYYMGFIIEQWKFTDPVSKEVMLIASIEKSKLKLFLKVVSR